MSTAHLHLWINFKASQVFNEMLAQGCLYTDIFIEFLQGFINTLTSKK